MRIARIGQYEDDVVFYYVLLLSSLLYPSFFEMGSLAPASVSHTYFYYKVQKFSRLQSGITEGWDMYQHLKKIA
jgi:hypothetical protein